MNNPSSLVHNNSRNIFGGFYLSVLTGFSWFKWVIRLQYIFNSEGLGRLRILLASVCGPGLVFFFSLRFCFDLFFVFFGFYYYYYYFCCASTNRKPGRSWFETTALFGTRIDFDKKQLSRCQVELTTDFKGSFTVRRICKLCRDHEHKVPFFAF